MRKNKKIKDLLISAFVVLCLVFDKTAFCQGEVKYKSGAKRDPFVPLVGISAKSVVSGVKGLVSIEDAVLQGTVIAPTGNRAVIINGEVIEKGVTVGKLTVLSVEDNEVIIDFNGKTHKLKLYE